jgi:putative transposase
MDNLGSHKSAALRRMIRAAGARLWYLPPYSPDLNPIEQAFAKIKHWMRAAQKRTVGCLATSRRLRKQRSKCPE